MDVGVKPLLYFGRQVVPCTKRVYETRLVSETVPGHHGQLDDHEGERDGKQVPAPNVVVEHAVFENTDGDQGGDDSGQAGGAAAVLHETLVRGDAEDSANECHVHFSFSSWKIWSVEELKMRAKIRASSRLGT